MIQKIKCYFGFHKKKYVTVCSETIGTPAFCFCDACNKIFSIHEEKRNVNRSSVHK